MQNGVLLDWVSWSLLLSAGQVVHEQPAVAESPKVMSKVFSTTTRDEWHAEHAWVKETKRMTALMTSLSAKIRDKPMTLSSPPSAIQAQATLHRMPIKQLWEGTKWQ